MGVCHVVRNHVCSQNISKRVQINYLWDVIITWLCDILALVWHFGPACVTFRPGLCDILALSCVTKASACHHTPILTTGAVYRKFHRSSVSKTILTTIQQFHRVIADSCYCVRIILTAFKHFDMEGSRYRVTSTASLDDGIVRQQFPVAKGRHVT